MFWPGTKRARAEHRNTTTAAMSSGRPTRANGVLSVMCCSWPRPRSSSSKWVIGVAIIPGDTALTRIDGAYSSAADAVSAATAAFAAAYGASPAAGRVPEIDAVDTTAPPPDSKISGATALNPWNTPVRFRVTMRCHSASSHSWMAAIELPPALLNRSVKPPSCACASRAAPFNASKSVTSTAYAVPSIERATSSARSLSRSTTATRAPSAAMRRHVAAPMPDAPPVMSARCPSSRPIAGTVLAGEGGGTGRANVLSLPGRLAQLVEHLHDAQEVRRSSRLPPTRPDRHTRPSESEDETLSPGREKCGGSGVSRRLVRGRGRRQIAALRAEQLEVVARVRVTVHGERRDDVACVDTAAAVTRVADDARNVDGDHHVRVRLARGRVADRDLVVGIALRRRRHRRGAADRPCHHHGHR